MPGIIIDDRCEPLLVVVFPDRPLTDAEWIEFLDELKAYQDGAGPLLTVHDVTGTNHLPNAKQRALIADKSADFNDPEDEAFVVMPSAVIRGIAKAIDWMTRRAHPMSFYKTFEEALSAAVDRAREKNLTLKNDPNVLLSGRAQAG